MSGRIFTATCAAAALALGAACANNNPSPLSPSSSALTAGAAAPDGSTLKVAAPNAVAPGEGARLDHPQPVLRISNAEARFGDTPNLEYRFEIQTAGGQFVMNSPKVTAADGETAWGMPSALDQGTFQWRARAEVGTSYGPWSPWTTFEITAPPSLLPPGPYPTTPPEILQFVAANYPERLRARVSLPTRKANMAFLRDRIIEIGTCVGLEIARHRKRGGPEHSIDFLAYKTSGRWRGVDIAVGYDDTDSVVRLAWALHDGPGFPDAIPNPERCRN